MTCELCLKHITPTVFLRAHAGGLQQLVKVSVANGGGEMSAVLTACLPRAPREVDLGRVPGGDSTHEIFLDELGGDTDVEFLLEADGFVADRTTVTLRPPRHWSVHMVQRSHHDVGYTDLPSRVLRVHDRWLDEAIDMAEATSSFPEDARFRIVIEQTWSVDHFLRNSPPERVQKMVKLLASQCFELTAFFGNMTTEICGHEVMARSLYHAFRLRRAYGIPIISAEHNDVPGISWGVAQVLTEAGIKLFCPLLPQYYGWGGLGMQSSWDEQEIFPHGAPGAFWWEAPSGKRLLFWYNLGATGGCRASIPGLTESLQRLEERGYPYSVLRWPVGGGARDNSPYIEGYSHTIKQWNEKWAYPHLISSNNSMFYQDLIRQIPPDLPVLRGELPGQDYPVASTSTAEATAYGRRNHAELLAAEKLASLASCLTDYSYQHEELFDAYEDVLWYDEHTWGHHFPCGPAARASQTEKATHAHRAAALAHDVTNKAMARIADSIALNESGFHLVVFNPSSGPTTGVVRTPLREMDNCGSTMARVSADEDPEGEGYLRGVLLTDRWHANPPLELVAGKFDLVDTVSGDKVPFQIIPVESPDDTVPYAAERVGLGAGGKRYGFFEVPLGLRRDLCFVAKEVPSCGYRTYRLAPRDGVPEFEHRSETNPARIENEFYRVFVDEDTGTILSIYDKSAGRDLVDPGCSHGFGELVVRTPAQDTEFVRQGVEVRKAWSGPVGGSIEVTGRVLGHPRVKQTVSLYSGIKEIYVDMRVLKDSTPLLDAHLAFPFLTTQPVFRYEGVLAAMTPIIDYLPGSYSDTIAVQNWVKVTDRDYNILWSSLDAPVAGLSGLWPGYVSPAHRCVIDERAKHTPLRPEDLQKGWIYSNLFYNNLGTNFSVSQVGDVLFRYVITTAQGPVSDGEAASWGSRAVTPLETIFTKKPRQGSLPPAASFLEVDGEQVILLTLKAAEDKNGYMVRLWNMAPEPKGTKVRIHMAQIKSAEFASIVEEDRGGHLCHDEHGLTVTVPGRSVQTLRLILASAVGSSPAGG